MQFVMVPVVLFASYLIGSTPFGLLIVWFKTGKDIRKIESGRTGGTNVMRATGFVAGLTTAILDLLKSAATVWLVRFLTTLNLLPATAWLEVMCPVLAVLGHNWSIFLLERNAEGRIRLRGGAGGASAAGGAFGLWPPSILIVLPIGMFFLFGVGYASLATLSVALTSCLLFAYRAWLGASPWPYILYGLFVGLLMAWTLRPNLQRLLNGTERKVGLRARRSKPTEDSANESQS